MWREGEPLPKGAEDGLGQGRAEGALFREGPRTARVGVCRPGTGEKDCQLKKKIELD